MVRAQGARAQMALAFETVMPASGFTRMPFATTTLGAEQPLLNRSCWATAAIRWRRSRTR